MTDKEAREADNFVKKIQIVDDDINKNTSITPESFIFYCIELGYFVMAKCFKTRVEKFYLFFDPWPSLQKGETNRHRLVTSRRYVKISE